MTDIIKELVKDSNFKYLLAMANRADKFRFKKRKKIKKQEESNA